MLRTALPLLAAGLLAAAALRPTPAQAAELPPVPAFETELRRDHPLVGTIRAVADGRTLTPAGLARRAADSRFVLLGERHDNRDHHALQAWVLEAMTALNRRPAVAFEMIDQGQAPALERYLSDHPKDAAGLGPAVAWEERGWPAWETYRPIAEVALAHALPILAANPDRSTTRKVGRQGLGALAGGRRAELGLDVHLPQTAQDALLAELEAGHCDMLPKAALGPMAKVQRLRDAVMADTLIAAVQAQDRGAVLITGGGHARADRAVPWYLRQRLTDPAVFVVRFVEVQKGQTDWRAYLPGQPGGQARAAQPVFDALWFTPAHPRPDPCERFSEQMKQHGADMGTVEGEE
jgi:uncharacterized iron-regulated protein